MTNIISVDFKTKELIPKMRWSKEEIQEVYDTETDNTRYNIQEVYDYDAYYCFNIGDDVQ